MSEEQRTKTPGTHWALLGVGALVLVSGALMWTNNRADDAAVSAESRDALVITAKRDIATLNSLDYRKVNDGLKAWADASTGTLRDQFRQIDDENRKLLTEQKKVTTGRVVDAAVTELSQDAGTVIAAVEITVRDDAKKGSEPSVKRNRFSADFVKVGDGWKLENLQQVAVNIS